MNSIIYIKGVETNNLKNIDISIKKKTINLIIGPSGSGKSSIAYDTIAQIGQYEFNSMFSDVPLDTNFKVRSYSNMIATIPIKQTNNNNNTRSTIGTYFNINSHIATLYSALLEVPYDFFVLNKEENVCPECLGLGHSKELDPNKIIDHNVALKKCPVKCWVKYKKFYISIIKSFCAETRIDDNKKFKELSDKEKELFLYGESETKYSIRYKKTSSYSKRTTKFLGILTNKPMIPKFTPGKSFYSDKECPLCRGEKYSQRHRDVKLCDISIGELMCIPFYELNTWIKEVQTKVKDSNLNFSLQLISNFIKQAISLNLGHLYLNRTIPSLSGGELQRIRLVQVFNTQLTDLLIILDEPLAGLSSTEKEIVCNNIKHLSQKHTLLLIDHNNLFYSESSNIIALGERSGKYGGAVIDTQQYIKSQSIIFNIPPQKEKGIIKVSISNSIYKYNGIDIDFAEHRLNLITGKSGIGKSTLLREYLPQFFEKYSYISQKPLTGNSNSNVATVLNIYNLIIENLSKKYGKEKTFFSNHTGCDGTCTSCAGTGKVYYGNDFNDKTQIICKECSGTGFNKRLKAYTIAGFTLFDIWLFTIDEAYKFFIQIDNRITKRLFDAKEIMLGHLLIGQHTASLSGGENIRIKILRSLKTTSSVYGIDEPFRGLNNFEIYKLAAFFNKFIEKNKTIIIVDHEDESFKYFTRHLILTCNDNRLIATAIGNSA